MCVPGRQDVHIMQTNIAKWSVGAALAANVIFHFLSANASDHQQNVAPLVMPLTLK